ncbi:MAG: DUF4331 family protein [Gemmatimonadota bacterium]|nr:DUF4331 family protein [Gemmatimonadota bacterium]
MQHSNLKLSLAAALLLAGCGGDSMAPDVNDARNALTGKNLVQMERFGLPAVAAVFIPTSSKDAYNTAAPAGDRAAFRPFLVSTLTTFGHPNPGALADALLPDIQPINLAQATTFLNGRRLQDDVITAELGLIFGSNAALNDDNVSANDKAFLNAFPFLAAPFLP